MATVLHDPILDDPPPAGIVHTVVADDDPLQAAFIAAILEDRGHRVTVAEDGEQAIAALRESGASLLVCDVEMPKMDGVEVARAIRKSDFGRYVYVLLVTVRSRSGDYAAGLSAGADDFMPKPIDPALLTVRVQAAERLLRYQEELQTKTARLQQAHNRIQEDLAAAGATQRALLPRESARIGGCSAWPLFMPSQHVSGDMYNYFELKHGLIGFYAADVAGHGVRAALLAATVGHTVTADFFWSTATAGPGGSLEPYRVVDALNRRFASGSEGGYFTFLCGVIDRAGQWGALCQAGHPSPLLVDAAGATGWLGDGGFPVGLFEEAGFADCRFAFRGGDRLIVHSDGIGEAMNAVGELYGEERLRALALQHRGQDADVLRRAVQAEMGRWAGEAGPADDISMIIFDNPEQPDD